MSTQATERYRLDAADGIPNNPRLPVVVYRGTVRDGDDLRDRLEDNGWTVGWRGGIYAFHHFHSTAHEFLGVVAGDATLHLGGPGGPMIPVAAGDALVLPAGTGHRCVQADTGFAVLGAYPDGQEWDLLLFGEGGDDVAARIVAVPLPSADPLDGIDGPLTQAWDLAPT